MEITLYYAPITCALAPYVTLTEAGEAAFQHLLGTVIAFDEQMRAGLSARELATLAELLERLLVNAADASTRSAGSGQA